MALTWLWRTKAHRTVSALLAVPLIALTVACGTDFVDPEPVGARADTPEPEATVFRVIPVTPMPTATPLPPAEGPDGLAQRPFPSEIDPTKRGPGLPQDAVLAFWAEYLSDSRLIIEGREDRKVDVHICADGTLFPGSASTFVTAGTWGLRGSSREWFEVIVGREFRAGRISGFANLSRNGTNTVALNEGNAVNVVSVTDSDLCGTL